MSTPKGKLAGKVAVVTASTDGIGLAIARRLCQDGAKVVISSRKQQNVDSALETLRGEGLAVSGLVCHVGKAEDRERLVQQTLKDFGGIDIFVSNAAVNPYFGPMLNTPEAAWEKIFDINLKATFLLVKEIVPHIEERGGGAVVLVSSIGGYKPEAMMGAYGVSKTAMLGLAKALTSELASRNIRINVLSPGLIKTHFSETLWKNDALLENVLSTIPLGRMGESEDCAGTVSFLVSEDARYITGESIVVAGGMASRL